MRQLCCVTMRARQFAWTLSERPDHRDFSSPIAIRSSPEFDAVFRNAGVRGLVTPRQTPKANAALNASSGPFAAGDFLNLETV